MSRLWTVWAAVMVLTIAEFAVAGAPDSNRQGSPPIMTLNGMPVAEATAITLDNGKLKLAADTDATFQTKGVTAKARGSVSIEVGPATAGDAKSPGQAPKTLTLTGGVAIGARTTVEITGTAGYRLALDSVTAEPDAVLNPTTSSLAVGSFTSSAALKLDGTSGGNTLASFDGKVLEKQGKGTWTITGDNRKQTGMVAVHAGTLYVGKGASLGTGQVSLDGGATLKLAPGASVGAPFIRDGVVIDLADGAIGTTICTGTFTGPNGGKVTLRFDLSDKGADHLIIEGCGNTPAISDLVEFNIISHTLTPGTYPLITNHKPALQMEENHFAFSFTADPVPQHKYSTRQTVSVGGKKYELRISTYDEVAAHQVLALTIKETK